jgi:hypothetical protein
MRKKSFLALALALTLVLALAGCGDKADSDPGDTKPGLVADSPAGGLQPAASTEQFSSDALALSFAYPGDWALEEEGQIITISAPSGQGSVILIADVTYETSLMLAGYGDAEASIDAMLDKYAGKLCGDASMENYDYTWDETDGQLRASASFTFGANSGFVDVDQVGSRVFLSAVASPAASFDTALSIYSELNGTFAAQNTDGDLPIANLSDLGFPEAPSGFDRFYSPITGQFFFYPSQWYIHSSPHDDAIIIYNDSGAIMITENWTESFYELYNANGNDEVACFDSFLNECAATVESYNEWTPDYYDFEYLATENQELIKAVFNYDVPGGTGRCFAEFGVREGLNEGDTTDYIQGTLCMYAPGDSYSIDTFSIIMDSIVIFYAIQ